jgi:hypothetical protein
MNSFLVRIELHKALLESTYVQLHNAMAKSGFSRQILANDGKYYWLPQAMYVASSSLNAIQVKQAAENAAATTGLSAIVFVAQMPIWAASGLIPVQQVVTAR